jgi:hypothetical protein
MVANSTEDLRLVVSERPIAAKRLTPGGHPNVSVWPVGYARDPHGYIVFADMSSAPCLDDCRSILSAAKRVLAEKAESLTNRSARYRKSLSAGKLPTLRGALGIDKKS